MQRGMFSNGIGALLLAVAMTATSAPSMAAELATADYIAIQQLYARYNTTIDHGDADGWAATFTPDGVFAGSFKGTEALKGFVNTWRTNPAMNGAARRHFSADLVIAPSAEGATGTVSTILVDLSTKPASMNSYVTYSDVLVKTAAGWRFKSRAIKQETAPVAAAPAVLKPAQ